MMRILEFSPRIMNIDEIAKLAGVSTATISRVINASPKVKPSTSEHVRRIIERFNYVPNTSARSLRVGRTRLFGLIVSDIKNPFFPELIDRFEALAEQHGGDVIFTHTNYDLARLDRCVRRMVERNVDGIAVMTSEIDAPVLRYLARTQLPVVLLNQAGKIAAGFSSIAVDYEPGYLEAVEHLRRLGHRDIGFLAGPEAIGSGGRRFIAFQRAMDQQGLKLRKKWIVPGDFYVEGGRRAMADLLDQEHRPSAVIAANDLMAVGALQALHLAKMSAPEDISIIGFDNIDACTMTNPTLTSIGLSRETIATEAFYVLYKMMNSERKIRLGTKLVSTTLVVRASTGPVKR
jgi:LacI family transcriptional regulator